MEKKPKTREGVSCYECPREALSVCSAEKVSTCTRPFCHLHGISHDLTLWAERKLLTAKEEKIIEKQAECRSLSNNIDISRFEGICTRCYERRSFQKLAISGWLMAFLATCLLLILASAAISWSQKRSSLLSHPNCLYRCIGQQVEFEAHISSSDFLAYSNFKHNGECQYEYEEEDGFMVQEIWCKCRNRLETFFNSTCAIAPCKPTEFRNVGGTCIPLSDSSKKEMGSHGCLKQMYYNEYAKGCLAAYCPWRYVIRDDGSCQRCPPYYKKENNTCVEYGESLTGKSAFRQVRKFGLDRRVSPDAHLLPCSRGEHGQSSEMIDALGQLQCISSTTQTYSDDRPCQGHEILLRSLIGCSFSCPPGSSIDFIRQKCSVNYMW